ncbi:hypothetical protein PSTT_00999 [Puccinia striiformis]|uniref:Alpha-type protein kinase domain-containing protein n=3 Tax=Puccinia striiformis TaxID=27350 RepID=A0A0L0USI4_9BASI|nr:hypothetical protein PSTG_16830 [Puccinia striiformis f. sp. tritici PST-78]POW16849.1 hypothetical protein PSTT_00999 [Puccinia striiformis]
MISEATARNKPHFDLAYQHPSNLAAPYEQVQSRKIPATTNTRNCPQPVDAPSQKRCDTSPGKVGTSKSLNQLWEMGGPIAFKPANHQTSLDSHWGRLGKRVHSSTSGQEEDWITGNRLSFSTTPRPPNFASSSINFQLSNGIHETTFFINRVKKDQIIGQGSMRTAYAAEVKTLMADRIEWINNWGAKVCIGDTHPSIHQHATDALMYDGFAHLLGQFKHTTERCSNLDVSLKKKASMIELVRNFNFAVTQNQPGMDGQLFQIMNALTHWSYNQFKGKLLVSDLQGVGPILTDPQIIDMDPNSRSDGNTGQLGIQQFIEEHVCHPGNKACKALQLGKAVN